MSKHPNYIPLHDLPSDGRSYELNEQTFWEETLREFKMDCRLDEAVHCTFSIIPNQGGVFLRGFLEANITLPCSRCAEDAKYHIVQHFDEFEPYPRELAEQDSENDFDYDGESRIVLERGLPMLDIDALLWEEFVLALPSHPLCKKDCQGLCPKCGINRNIETCSCVTEEGDPRLAIFRTLHIASKTTK